MLVWRAFRYGLLFNLAMCLAAGVAVLTPGGETAAVGVIGFFLGSAAGSFLNVLAYRPRAGLPLFGEPSHCPRCKAPVRDRHNLPVLGWLLLGGRCADCREPISWTYPAVELAGGCLGGLVAMLP